MEEKTTVTRSVKIDVSAPDELRRKIINSIRLYRQACRQTYCVMTMAQMAGSTVSAEGDNITIKPPDKELGTQLLAATFGKNPARTAFKTDFLSTALSFVWDSVRQDISARWSAKDTEYPKTSRGFLTLNGSRDLARFNRIGIGCPRLTARPQLFKQFITLKWDHEIGEVLFTVGKLDGCRYRIWKNLRDGADGWSMGTIYLNERDGKTFFIITYSRPDKKEELDKSRILNVEFTEDEMNFIKLRGPDTQFNLDGISSCEATAWLDELSKIRGFFERRKAAVGSPVKPWGSKEIFKGVQHRLTKNTERRANGVKDRNHLWTRRIVARAISWNCGTVAVARIPEKLFGREWQWYQFRQFLNYKTSEIGVNLIVES